MVAIHTALGNEPERSAELDESFRQFITRWNKDTAGRSVQIPYEYLLAIAHKRDA